MKPELIVALDMNNKAEAEKLLDKLSKTVRIFKIGPYLFTRYGPEIVKLVHSYNCNVFLDLKLHDIPNTVAGSIRQMVKLKVLLLSIHTQGGLRMMKEANQAADDEAEKRGVRKPLILGITVLSSFDREELNNINTRGNLETQILRLSQLAKRAGLDGVVAPAKEAPDIKSEAGDDFIVASAGIRPLKYSKDDQRIITTPKKALEYGADYIIVGRPIIRAKNPRKAACDIIEEIS
jgi:orotidine-5'-phosphate decarboxylase